MATGSVFGWFGVGVWVGGCFGGGGIFFFLGNFGGDGLVFMAKFWWKVVVIGERERERDFSKYYLMCSLYYF